MVGHVVVTRGRGRGHVVILVLVVRVVVVEHHGATATLYLSSSGSCSSSSGSSSRAALGRGGAWPLATLGRRRLDRRLLLLDRGRRITGFALGLKVRLDPASRLLGVRVEARARVGVRVGFRVTVRPSGPPP